MNASHASAGSSIGSNSERHHAALLNTVLADTFALYLKTKNFHWHVSGPHFRGYHLMFDEQASELLAMTDQVAERVRKIGHRTLTSIGDIARRQTVHDSDDDSVPARSMLLELHADTASLLGSLRDARHAAEAAGDTATSSMIDDWIERGERRRWFLLEASRED